MINKQQLLSDLQRLLRTLETDLRVRCDELPAIATELQREYDKARAAKRAGGALEEWRAEQITQLAVAWVLSCVFLRFLEDNALIAPPRLAGGVANGSMQRARDERDLYFRAHPTETDRHYLLAQFDVLAKLPGLKEVFGAHNPVADPNYRDWLSGDAAQTLLAFFQKVDTDGTGELLHDFTDPVWDTRFLGDLYQDLSEAVRKKYALLQTPEFVEEFILERTLEPAIREFQLVNTKMIDPACGSGHFLLGGFRRILGHWRQSDPSANDRELVNRSLAAVHGVDLNPYAIAIARFRLLLAAMRECHISRLHDAPTFTFNLACGDSLLHGGQGQLVLGFHELAHAYQSEDIEELRRILKPGQYQAVVANPPYITVKDRLLNQAYRDRYPDVCHMKYSLSVPFLQRLFDLACSGGFTGQITANSFMKREFGKKLIENYLPRIDLTHVIDTSGAYIPGHGTPTVILFGRQRSSLVPNIRTVMGIKGEPATPANPAQGLVWTAICQQVDVAGSKSAFVDVADTTREQFHKHPWSIGGGGAAELKEFLENVASKRLVDWPVDMGIYGITAADDIMLAPRESFIRRGVCADVCRPLIVGDEIRDWERSPGENVLYPYNDTGLLKLSRIEGHYRWLWPYRTVLWVRATFAKTTYREEGRTWWEWHQICLDRIRTPLSIVFGEVATHNHFVLDRGGKVFKQTAPVIKMPVGANEEEHLALLGLLNSSTACFWLKQVCFPKGGDHVGQEGARVRQSLWDERYAFNATNVEKFPLPSSCPMALARVIDQLAQALAEVGPASVMARPDVIESVDAVRAALASAAMVSARTQAQMIAFQEELDWECYKLYGLLPDAPRCENPPPLRLGERAFEIVLARKMAAGEEETSWFERHGSTPITDLPTSWPADYRRVVEQRIQIINDNLNIGLIERPENKRRWNTEPWDEQQARALRSWLLNRLESYFDLDGRMNAAKTVTAHASLQDPKLVSVAQVADIARGDPSFMAIAQLQTGRVDFDVTNLVGELMARDSVPALPVLRYKPDGLDKRQVWERTWELQRLEDMVTDLFERMTRQLPLPDAGMLSREVNALRLETSTAEAVSALLADAIAYVQRQEGDPGLEIVQRKIKEFVAKAQKVVPGDIPVPPKYTSADFLKPDFWRLRGKLDVPKERWVSFPYCENEDGTLMVAWAGYNHLQLAQAIAGRYEQAKEREGRRLEPLLAAIDQLIPWLKQWHNELDAAYGVRMGDYFAGYLAEEGTGAGKTVEEIRAWKPPASVPAKGRGKKKRDTAVE